jgi:hypothetical protein
MEAIKSRYGDRFVDLHAKQENLFGNTCNDFTNSVFYNKWVILRYGQLTRGECDLVCVENSMSEYMENEDLYEELMDYSIDEYDIPDTKKMNEVLKECKNFDNWKTFLGYSAEEGSMWWAINTDANSKYYQHVIHLTRQLEGSQYMGHIANVIANIDTLVFELFDDVNKYFYNHYETWDLEFMISYLRTHEIDNNKFQKFLYTRINVYSDYLDSVKPILENAPQSFLTFFADSVKSSSSNVNDILHTIKVARDNKQNFIMDSKKKVGSEPTKM